MRYDIRYRNRSSLFYWSFPSGVKWLIIANVAIYLIYFFGSLLRGDEIFRGLMLVPAQVVRGAIWQLVTYMFLHSLQSFWHILFNMLTLWMFGAPVEETWGTRRFLQYYFLCGIGAGVCVVLANVAFGNAYLPVIGASGAIYGLLLAYGMLFPNQEVLFMFLFPLKAKYMVMIFGAIAFLSSFQGGGPISNLAHLGGMIFGFIYIRTQFGRRRAVAGPGFSFDLKRRWKEYRLQRAKRKFQVYMKKHGSGPGPWTN
ncbi:MAG TPA: rhomboid family intramembrane serine protease [Bryobacteraceae bacterium]|jgi:membrane associated rhomboid family serine protease|nr:rhomboid family intramembrane serine protease [Bryobacteraceae bacterium]